MGFLTLIEQEAMSSDMLHRLLLAIAGEQAQGNLIEYSIEAHPEGSGLMVVNAAIRTMNESMNSTWRLNPPETNA